MLKPILLAIILSGCLQSELVETEPLDQIPPDPEVPPDPPISDPPIIEPPEPKVIARIGILDNPGNAPEDMGATAYIYDFGVRDEYEAHWTLVNQYGEFVANYSGERTEIALPEIGVFFLRLEAMREGVSWAEDAVRLGTGEFYQDPIQCSGSYDNRICTPATFYVPAGMDEIYIGVTGSAGDIDRLVLNQGNPELQGEVTIRDPDGFIQASTRFWKPHWAFDIARYVIEMQDASGFKPGTWSVEWKPDHYGPDAMLATTVVDDLPYLVDWPVFYDGWTNPEATPRNERPESPDFKRKPSIQREYYDVGCHGQRILLLDPEDTVIPPKNYTMQWIATNQNGTEAARGEGWDSCWHRPPVGRYQFTGIIMNGTTEVERFNKWARFPMSVVHFEEFVSTQEWMFELNCDVAVLQTVEATNCDAIQIWGPEDIGWIRVNMWPANILDPHTRDDGTTGNVTIHSPSGKLIASQGPSYTSLQGSDWENYINIYEPTEAGYWTIQWQANQAIAKEGIMQIFISAAERETEGVLML